MQKIIQRTVFFLLLFSFSMNVVKIRFSNALELNEDNQEESFKFVDESDDESETYEFRTDFFSVSTDQADKSCFYDKVRLDRALSFRYTEPLIEQPYSPPELMA